MIIEQKDERNLIQILRGIAILLVVYHHVVYAAPMPEYMISSILILVSKVHIAIFFVISGWLFQKKRDKYSQLGFKKFALNKFSQLMIPYFLFTLMFNIAVWTASKIDSLKGIVYRIADSEAKSLFSSVIDILFYYKPYFRSLWFLYSLFIIMIIVYILRSDRFIKTGYMIFYIVLSMIYGVCCIKWYANDAHMVSHGIMSYFSCVMLGRWLYVRLNKGFKLKYSYLIICLPILIICCYRCAFIDLREYIDLYYIRQFYYQLETWLMRISSIVIILAAAKAVCSCKSGKILKYIGDRSYDIYLIHNPWFVSAAGITLSMFLPWYITLAAGIAAAVIGSIAVSLILQKYVPGIYNVFFGNAFKR